MSLSAYGNTALHLVCDRGLVDNAKLLLEWGADATMSNTAGAFPAEVWKPARGVFYGFVRGILRVNVTAAAFNPPRNP